MYEEALIKSILFKLPHYDNHTVTTDRRPGYPTLQEMSLNRRFRKHQIPFIAVPYNNGCTTSHNPNLSEQQRMSFGCPRYFFRLNFTSAIEVSILNNVLLDFAYKYCVLKLFIISIYIFGRGYHSHTSIG